MRSSAPRPTASSLARRLARVRELCDNAARRGAPCTGSALLRRRYVSTSVIARTSLFFTACFLYSFLAICAHLTVLLTEISKRRVRPCAPSTKQQAVRSRARSACAVCARVDGLCLVESIQARATAGLRPREHAWCAMFSGGHSRRERARCVKLLPIGAQGGHVFYSRVRGLMVHYGRRNRRRGSPAQGGGFTLRTYPGGADPDAGNSRSIVN